MNYLMELIYRIRESFAYDAGCYSVAHRLVMQMGNEEALRYIRTSTTRSRGLDARRWKQIENAILDISRPDIPYHL